VFNRLLSELTLSHILTSLSILVAFAGLAWFLRVFLVRVVRRLTQQTETGLDDAIVSALGKPIVVIVVLTGVYLAGLVIPLEPTPRLFFSRGLALVLSLLGIYTGVALLNAVIRWYVQEILKERREAGLSSRLLQFCRAGIILVALLAGVLTVLQFVGIKPVLLTGWIGEHGWRITFIIVLTMGMIIAIGEVAPRVVVSTLSRRAGEPEDEVSKRGATLSRVLVDTGQVAVLFMTVFMVLSELKLDVAPILAGVGIAGLAIGFGAQSLVKDLVAGLFIILENQYRVGDAVRIADVSGVVEDINLRRTILRDLDGSVHTVPNGEIRVASNLTKEYARVNLNISVAYDTDLDRAMAVINRVGKELAADPEWASCILVPPHALRVDNLGDSGIEIKILGDTRPTRQWDVTGELRLRLKKAFDAEGIEIPWPHTKVYFGNSPSLGQKESTEK